MKRILWGTLIVIAGASALVFSVLRFGDPDQIPFLKSIAILLPLLIALCGIRREKERSDSLHRIGFPFLYFGAASVACIILWADLKTVRESNAEARALRQKEEYRKTQEQTHIHKIGEMRGDVEMGQKYIQGLRKVTQQYTAEKTEAAVEHFFNSREERQKVRVEVRQVNEKILLTSLMRTEPLCDFVTGKFDSWIVGIKKRGVEVTLQQFEEKPVSSKPRAWYPLRTATFANGMVADIQILPSKVEDGRLLGGAAVFLNFRTPNEGSDCIWQLSISEENYSISNPKPARFTFKETSGNLPAPIEDLKFSTAVNDSLDQVMAYIVENVALNEPLK